MKRCIDRWLTTLTLVILRIRWPHISKQLPQLLSSYTISRFLGGDGTTKKRQRHLQRVILERLNQWWLWLLTFHKQGWLCRSSNLKACWKLCRKSATIFYFFCQGHFLGERKNAEICVLVRSLEIIQIYEEKIHKRNKQQTSANKHLAPHDTFNTKLHPWACNWISWHALSGDTTSWADAWMLWFNEAAGWVQQSNEVEPAVPTITF